MAENIPKMRSPKKEEISVQPTDGLEIKVAAPETPAEQDAAISDAEYRQTTDNPMLNEEVAGGDEGKPKIIEEILKSAENQKGNVTPGMNNEKDTPWMDSGAEQPSGDALLFNAAERGFPGAVQRKNRL